MFSFIRSVWMVVIVFFGIRDIVLLLQSKYPSMLHTWVTVGQYALTYTFLIVFVMALFSFWAWAARSE